MARKKSQARKAKKKRKQPDNSSETTNINEQPVNKRPKRATVAAAAAAAAAADENQSSSTTKQRRQMLQLEEEILQLETSIETLNSRKQQTQTQLETGRTNQRLIREQLTEQSERKIRLDHSHKKHLKLLQDLQKSLSKSQEILVRFNDDGNTGLLSKEEIEQLTVEIQEQEQRAQRQQQEQDQEIQASSSDGHKDDDDFELTTTSFNRSESNRSLGGRRKSHSSDTSRHQRVEVVQNIYDQSNLLEEFWDHHGDATKEHCLMGFLPCIRSKEWMVPMMEIMTREVLGQDSAQGPLLQSAAEYRRQSLWNTCLDFRLMAGNCVRRIDSDRKVHSNRNSRGTTAPASMDPHVALCPYELAGVCADPYCPYQHLLHKDRPGGIAILPKELLPLPQLRLPPEPVTTEEAHDEKPPTEEKTIEKASQDNNEDEARKDDTSQAYEVSEVEPSKISDEGQIKPGKVEEELSQEENNVSKANGEEFSGNNDFVSFDAPSESMQTVENSDSEDEDGENIPDLETAGLISLLRPRHATESTAAKPSRILSIWWLSEQQNESLHDSTISFEAWLGRYGEFCLPDSQTTQITTRPSLEYKGSTPTTLLELCMFIGRFVDCSRVAIQTGRFDVVRSMTVLASVVVDECDSSDALQVDVGSNESTTALLQLCREVMKHTETISWVAFGQQNGFRHSFEFQLCLAMLSDLMETVHENGGEMTNAKMASYSDYAAKITSQLTSESTGNANTESPPGEALKKGLECHQILMSIKAAMFRAESKTTTITQREEQDETRCEVNLSLLDDLQQAIFFGQIVRSKVSLQVVTESVIKPLSSIVKSCLRQRSGTKTYLRAWIFLAYIIFGALEGAVDHIESEGESLSAQSISFLVQLDASIYNMLVACRRLGAPFLDLLSSSLIAATVAFASHLGNYSKSQHRLEEILVGPTSSEQRSGHSTAAHSQFSLYSELLWSQLIHLRASLPLSAQIEKNGVKSEANSRDVNSETSDSHNLIANRICAFGVHLHHVVSDGDWNLVARLKEAAAEKKKGANYKRVLALVGNHEEEKSVKFYMNTLTLSQIPASVRKINVTRKDLVNGFPRSLLLFGHKLQVLDVSGCFLSGLPYSMGQFLSNLEELIISRNKISLLPESLGELAQLHTFMADKNQISRLPDQFRSLMALRKIDLSDNQLDELPNSIISFLKNLEELQIGRNNFTRGVDAAQLTLALPKLRVFEK